jgi:hypothetical protein
LLSDAAAGQAIALDVNSLSISAGNGAAIQSLLALGGRSLKTETIGKVTQLSLDGARRAISPGSFTTHGFARERRRVV